MAQNDAVTVSEDVPFSSSISLLANDSDIDGDTLSVVAGTFVTGRVVHRRDRQGQGRGVGQAAVGDGVVHRVGAVEVRRRRVGVAAVHGDLHPGCRLQRRGHLQLHGDRRQPGLQHRHRHGQRGSGERRAPEPR
ncbi:Ig-like domain-containing protein [Pseudomonas stutzeri]|nr:Ig-like domain-containing protein [Stutzerimonas stutzeri]